MEGNFKNVEEMPHIESFGNSNLYGNTGKLEERPKTFEPEICNQGVAGSNPAAGTNLIL